MDVCPASQRIWGTGDDLPGNRDGPAPALETCISARHVPRASGSRREQQSNCIPGKSPHPEGPVPHPRSAAGDPPAGVILALGKVVPEKPIEEFASCLRRPCLDAGAAPTGSNYAPGKTADPTCKAGPVSSRPIQSRVGALRTGSSCDGRGPVPGTWAQRWACRPVRPRGSGCVAGPTERSRQTRSLRRCPGCRSCDVRKPFLETFSASSAPSQISQGTVPFLQRGFDDPCKDWIIFTPSSLKRGDGHLDVARNVLPRGQQPRRIPKLGPGPGSPSRTSNLKPQVPATRGADATRVGREKWVPASWAEAPSEFPRDCAPHGIRPCQ